MAQPGKTTIYLSDDLKARAEQAAKADRRSLSAYIAVVLERHLDAQHRADGAHEGGGPGA